MNADNAMGNKQNDLRERVRIGPPMASRVDGVGAIIICSCVAKTIVIIAKIGVCRRLVASMIGIDPVISLAATFIPCVIFIKSAIRNGPAILSMIINKTWRVDFCSPPPSGRKVGWAVCVAMRRCISLNDLSPRTSILIKHGIAGYISRCRARKCGNNKVEGKGSAYDDGKNNHRAIDFQ